jgi:hypothetical protein
MNIPKYRMWDAYHKKLGIVNVMIWMGDYVECDYDGLLGEPRRPDALDQSTGIQDHYGIEVFENDIILFEGRKRKIVLDKGSFWAGGLILGHIYQTFEVIGNIHQNPELLA